MLYNLRKIQIDKEAEMDYKEYLDNIEKKLEGYFDISKCYKINGYEYDLFAEYHLRTERYILSKKAVIYAMENNEYSLIKYFKSLDSNILNTYLDSLIKSIDIIVKPDENHMSSIITGVLVSEYKPDSYIVDTVKKFKYHKGFAFGFKGWVDIRLILVTIGDNYIVTNKKGKEVSKVYSIQ